MKFYLLLVGFTFFLLQGCKTGEKTSDIIIPKNIRSSNLIESKEYNAEKVEKGIVDRIKDGVYNDYDVDLCVDSLGRCNTNDFIKYKQDAGYSLKISSSEWDKYPDIVKKEILNEIIYYSWGHKKKEYNTLKVNFGNNESPLDFLNSKSKDLYTVFSKPEYLKGGKGKHAYGPNCWYMSVSSIADQNCQLSKVFNLASSVWNKPRFMGPTEFRCFMTKFEKVSSPQFGDVVRYYTDSAYYDESIDLYNGEVHAAIYIGRDSVNNRDIVLTKNGRNDIGFLLFEDIRGLDSSYLGKEKKDPRIRNYFRLKSNSTFYDPSNCTTCSDCYGAYKTDSINYRQRWDCLAGKLQPDTCGGKPSCYCFPLEWKK